MNTREKILAAALQLYNGGSMTAITSRHIAASLAISSGNLHYHFKQSDDIITALYERMSKEYEHMIIKLEQQDVLRWTEIEAFIEDSLKLVYEYRFIFINFLTIADRLPAVRISYSQIIQRRERQFINLFKQLVASGMFRSDIPDHIWSGLATHLFVLADFWIANNNLTVQLSDTEAVSYYKSVMMAVLYPYLKNPSKDF